ncbi:MAG: pilus assembly protein TadG-related protein [Planctomycetota bacterium]|nr:pilus assembly protein TadG-related protein [Planctomycetota bacterium]
MRLRNNLARDDRGGAMLVLVAVVLAIILVGTVFSVDVAYMHMVRAELRIATDAAARKHLLAHKTRMQPSTQLWQSPSETQLRGKD